MANLWDQELIQMVYEWNEKEVITYHRYLKEMINDQPVFLDSIAQYWNNQFFGYDLRDAYVYAQVKYLMEKGLLLFLQIPTEKTPFPDKAEQKNNDVLAALPEPLIGKFFGGSGDSDGYIKWDKPILMNVMKINENDSLVGAKVIVKPRQVPLEVGYTTSGTTYFHILRNRGLARFPYRQKRIHIWCDGRRFQSPVNFKMNDSGNLQITKSKRDFDLPEYNYATEWMPFEKLERYF